MEKWFPQRIYDLLSGSPTPPPVSSAQKGKRKHDYEGFGSRSTNSAATAGGAPRRTGKRDQGVHGIISSALWAIARTPVLVDAIKRVESAYGANTLSLVLGKLRDADLRDPSRLRAAVEAADAFLQDSRLPTYEAMEPMDAIRGIVGLCGDSERVLDEAVSTAYRCAMLICKRPAYHLMPPPRKGCDQHPVVVARVYRPVI